MKVDTKDLRGFSAQVASDCTRSQATRSAKYATYRKYFFDGAGFNDNNAPQVSDYNKIAPHVDELASYLYSPSEVRFFIEATRQTEDMKKLSMYETASDYLTRQFHLRDCDLAFSRALVWSLVYGSTFIKSVWNAPRKITRTDDLPVMNIEGLLDSYIIMPFQFGVLREDINGLDRQEAICQTTFVLADELDRQLRQHPDRAKIMEEVRAYTEVGAENRDGQLHSIFIGENNPIVLANPMQGGGQVNVQSNAPMVNLSPDVVSKLVKINELWVWDDEMEDYTTIVSVAGPGSEGGGPIIEGEIKRRNLYVPGEQPYTQVCPNEIEGSFWGQSEIDNLKRLQDRLNKRMDDQDVLIDLAADQPRSFTGFTGITEEKAMRLNTPGGWISEMDGNAKIQDLAPPIPKEIEQDIQMILQMFSDEGGLTPILQGQGESGVRSANHAETLVRTSSPRLRDRSLLIERQVAMCGDKVFNLLKDKIADQFETEDKQVFTLGQIEGDYKVTVDSHSSSPVFSKEAQDKVILMAKLGIIDGIDIIDLLAPPRSDTLIARLRQKQAAQAKLLKEHPELAVEGGKGKKKGLLGFGK